MKYCLLFESDIELNKEFLDLILENLEFSLFDDYDIILKPLIIKKG